MNIIETKQLTKKYGKSRGIVDLDLVVKQGEIFGFIGPNGAGKSTTIRTLLGLIKPTSGTAKLFGKDITRYGPSLREDIGYLPSEVFYYDGMRAIDLLKYSASFYHHRPQQAMMHRARELADILQLDLTCKIDDLSYGNKKKVGIIQGLLHSPKLIILDEPTGGLDPLAQQTFFDVLKKENENGATILFSSHILSEVQRLCDRVGIIKDGELVAVETIKSLRQNNYKRCRFELASKPSKKDFVLDGLTDLLIDDTTVSFLYRGKMPSLTSLMTALNPIDVWIEEPDLEDIFMHYYQKDT